MKDVLQAFAALLLLFGCLCGFVWSTKFWWSEVPQWLAVCLTLVVLVVGVLWLYNISPVGKEKDNGPGTD